MQEVYQHVADTGGIVVEEPREFPEYPPPYYATFWLDLNGVLLEAVCHRDLD